MLGVLKKICISQVHQKEGEKQPPTVTKMIHTEYQPLPVLGDRRPPSPPSIFLFIAGNSVVKKKRNNASLCEKPTVELKEGSPSCRAGSSSPHLGLGAWLPTASFMVHFTYGTRAKPLTH